MFLCQSTWHQLQWQGRCDCSRACKRGRSISDPRSCRQSSQPRSVPKSSAHRHRGRNPTAPPKRSSCLHLRTPQEPKVRHSFDPVKTLCSLPSLVVQGKDETFLFHKGLPFCSACTVQAPEDRVLQRTVLCTGAGSWLQMSDVQEVTGVPLAIQICLGQSRLYYISGSGIMSVTQTHTNSWTDSTETILGKPAHRRKHFTFVRICLCYRAGALKHPELFEIFFLFFWIWLLM